MRPWVALLLAVLTLLAVAAGAVAWWLQQPLTLRQATVELEIEPGQSPREVARTAVAAGVDTSADALYQWFRWSGDARLIKAGSYELGAGTTPRTLLRKLVDGDETLAKLRLIEGWNFRQLRAELQRAPSLKNESAALSDEALMAALGLPGVAPEGRFFPDTYTYAKGSSDLAVLRRALAAMQRRAEAAWAQRPPESPIRSVDELLTLASIVEKETGRAADRPLIAGVFLNRLRIGMPLQTDPSVIYGLGEAFDGNLRRRDLQADTPYNTYTRGGLPPTPIAMPGRESLWAVVKPASTKALYFVARGDGSSQFSETLADHNRAVNQYQRKAATAP